MVAPRARSDGPVRLTRVGFWYFVFTVIIAMAATNTGNNGLFLVLAMLIAAIGLAWYASTVNVTGLEISIEPVGEIFANRPAHLALELRHRGRWWPRWLLIVQARPADPAAAGASGGAIAVRGSDSRRRRPAVIERLEPGENTTDQLELLMRRRGRRRIPSAHVVSLFPFGLFRKGRHVPVDCQLLVYPEVFDRSGTRSAYGGRVGEQTARRPGRGQDLYALRDYRHGDDPRSIHWKQSARQGRLILQQRQADDNKRLLITFDNAVGDLESEARVRFEHLVSEAATAALDYLEDGFEVALVSRQERLPFATGGSQRRRLLELLAVIEPIASDSRPLLAEEPSEPHLRLAFDAAEPEPETERAVA